MAAPTSSPAISTNSTEAPGGTATPTPPPPSLAAGATGVRSPGLSIPRSEPPRNQRGLNKPKCITCGNVARSRCPFQCCKSCCSKAQNPCHIHVLKPNATLADRGAPSNSTTPEPQPSEVTPPAPPAKTNSIRQLSNTFSQFNNVHIPLRSRKPLSKKDALVINEWRFAKLKEYQESNIEAENEAFDRYMQNVSLLEEVFDVMPEGPEENGSEISDLPTASGGEAGIVSEMKAKIRSNPDRIDSFRKRVRQTADEGLKNFQMYESKNGANSLDNEGDLSPSAAKTWWAGKTSALTELNDKLNRARNEEDLKSCLQMRSNIKGEGKPSAEKGETSDTSNVLSSPIKIGTALESGNSYLVKAIEIDQDEVNAMNSYFSSLEEIEDL